MIAARFRVLIATAWAGSLWAVGGIAAPTLFAVLPEAKLAGMVAAVLFRIEAWISVACAFALLALLQRGGGAMETGSRRKLSWLVAAMLTCTLVGYFGLQPWMAELRAMAGPDGVMAEAVRTRFGILHGVASLFYLMQSLLAVVLVWKLR